MKHVLPYRVGVRPTAANAREVMCPQERQKLTANGWNAAAEASRTGTIERLVAETWRASCTVYKGAVITPCVPFEGSPHLKSFLKLENAQVTGSFKARGALHKLFSLDEIELRRGIVTSSTGNHALAVLHAWNVRCAQPGSGDVDYPPPLIYLPQTVSREKRKQLVKQGARLVTVGTDCIEAEAEGRRVGMERSLVYVSPYNDWQVAGGQGTVAVELLSQLRVGEVAAVLVAVGGGGLIAGMSSFLKSVAPQLVVVGCQPARSDVLCRSVLAGKVLHLESEDTLSEGTAGGVDADSLTLEPCMHCVDMWVTVEEREIAAALLELRESHNLSVEGSAAMTYACWKRVRAQLGEVPCALVVCGGNVNEETFEKAASILSAAQ